MEEGRICGHLFSGPAEGFTLARAFQQQGSDPEEILENDILRGKDHDVLSNDGVFGALLTARFLGKLKGLVGGPNRRTRSILRHKVAINPPGPQTTLWV